MGYISQGKISVDSEGAECTCGSDWEHKVLEVEVDFSFKKDKERAKMRQERNTHYLRMQVLKDSNGHNHLG